MKFKFIVLNIKNLNKQLLLQAYPMQETTTFYYLFSHAVHFATTDLCKKRK